ERVTHVSVRSLAARYACALAIFVGKAGARADALDVTCKLVEELRRCFLSLVCSDVAAGSLRAAYTALVGHRRAAAVDARRNCVDRGLPLVSAMLLVEPPLPLSPSG